MTDAVDRRPADTAAETDLVAEVRRVLGASPEPLTLSKIRAQLPPALRGIRLEDLAEVLRRQVAANVIYQYPKYRSQQDRFWDRPMPVHVASLLRVTLEEGPLPWSELRRKLPAYALGQAEAVLYEQVAQGMLHRHPRQGRGKERFGVAPADPKDYLRSELAEVFGRLGQLGFTQNQLREAALEMLHEEEWASAPPGHAGPAAEAPGTPQAETTTAAPASAPPAGQTSATAERPAPAPAPGTENPPA